MCSGLQAAPSAPLHPPAHPHHGARPPARPPNLQPLPRRPPAPHPPARCPGAKRRKRPHETLGRLHSLGNGGRTQDQPGSIARPHRKCRRVPPGRPLPRSLRFPARLGWGKQGQPLACSLSLCFPHFRLFGFVGWGDSSVWKGFICHELDPKTKQKTMLSLMV